MSAILPSSAGRLPVSLRRKASTPTMTSVMSTHDGGREQGHRHDLAALLARCARCAAAARGCAPVGTPAGRRAAPAAGAACSTSTQRDAGEDPGGDLVPGGAGYAGHVRASLGASAVPLNGASARSSRCTPSASRSSLAAKHQRTKPSPSGPKAIAGREPQPLLGDQALAELQAVGDAGDAEERVHGARRRSDLDARQGSQALPPGNRAPCRKRRDRVGHHLFALRDGDDARRVARTAARRRCCTRSAWEAARRGVSGAAIQPRRKPVISQDLEKVLVLTTRSCGSQMSRKEGATAGAWGVPPA